MQFPKGKTGEAKDIDWYGIVYESPRKKVDDGYATMGVEYLVSNMKWAQCIVKNTLPSRLKHLHQNVKSTKIF